MTRSRTLSTLMTGLLLVASISCSADSLTGVAPQQTTPAPVTPSVAPSASLLGGVFGILGGTVHTVTGTLGGTIGAVNGTLGPIPIVSPLLSTVSGLLVTCKPQRYASTTKWVGPRGGTLRIGPHTLVIPRGALKKYVRITGEAPRDTVVSVRFKPEGLTFDKDHPARLTLDYNACEVSKQNLPTKIAYTDDSLNVIEILSGTVVDKRDRTVSADVKHFSRYALAY